MRPLAQLSAFTCVLAAVGACADHGLTGDSWRPPDVVRIESEKELGWLLPAWATRLSDAGDGESQALLLRDGEFVLGEGFLFRYLASDGPTLHLTYGRGTVRLGETTISVATKEEDGRAWLGTASDRQLADLRHVSISKDLDPDTLAALRRLAAVHPDIDALFDSDEAFVQALPLFRPLAVFAGDGVRADSLGLLADQPQVETLLIEADSPRSFDVLSKLPNLRRLLLDEWNVEKAGPLPAGLHALRTLSVSECRNLKDLSPLRAAAPGLEELAIVGARDLKSLEGLEAMPNLATLVLQGDDELRDLPSLASLRRLRRVGLPPSTTQEQFAAFVGAHPDLAVVEMMDCKEVNDLAPLQDLKDLQALVLGGPGVNLGALHGLSSLRFVGISRRLWDASPEQIAALRKALPDAVIVQLKPFCLGSGWILVLVPILALAWWRRTRRRVGVAA